MTVPVAAAAPMIGAEERAAVDRVLASGRLAMGPEVAAFEQEFATLVAGRPCVAVNSGTSALHLALLALGIGPGDEVIVPSFTFAATANAVALAGASPVFADIDPASFCLDPAAADAAVTPRTAAIMPVHLYGHPADTVRLEEVARRHGLAVVEDAAQAHAASDDGRPVGSLGAAAAFSFYPTKNMTTGEGGMVVCADESVARQVRLLRNQGMERRYANEVVGFNLRMTDIAAAIGRVQLTRLGDWTERRRSTAAHYDMALTGVRTPTVRAGAHHVYHQYTVRLARPRSRGGCARGARDRDRGLLPHPGAPAAGVRPTSRSPGDRAGVRRGAVAARAPARRRRRTRPGRRRAAGLSPDGGRAVTGPVLRAGVVGLGSIGRNHARVLQTMDGVELVGVADPVAAPLRPDTGVPLLGALDELLAKELDFCVVSVPTTAHEAVALALAAAGVHTLVEKPIAHDVSSARRVAGVFEAAGLVGCVGHVERYNPALQHLRRRLAQGELGDVHQLFTRRQGPFPARIADVGVVQDLATHDIDLTAWVTQSSYRKVSAETAHRSGRTHEDLVAVVGRLADDTVVNHLVNWLSPLKERVTVVTGEKGCLVADTVTADLTFYANGVSPVEWDTIAAFRGVVEGDMVRYAYPKPEPLLSELTAFVAAVRGEGTDVVTMAEAVGVVEVAEAVVRSATTGLPVVLEPAQT